MVLSTTSISLRSVGDLAPARRRRKRIDGRFRPARRIKALIKLYSDRLSRGDISIIRRVDTDLLIKADIQRLAECEVLCEQLRATALRGEPVDLLALNRLEGTTKRLRSNLGLGGLSPKRIPTLKELGL